MNGLPRAQAPLPTDNRLSEFIDHCRYTMAPADIRDEMLAGRSLRRLRREQFIDLTEISTVRAGMAGAYSSAELVTQIQGRARRAALKEAMERKAA